MATEGNSSGSSYLRVGSVLGSTKELRSAVARAYLATGHGCGLWERQWVTEDVLVLRGGRATETEAGSVAVVLNYHIVQQSMFDNYYYVVHIVLRVRNKCDHNKKYTYFIIARSFAGPPSLFLLL